MLLLFVPIIFIIAFCVIIITGIGYLIFGSIFKVPFNADIFVGYTVALSIIISIIIASILI